jgi:CO/xanthine dehydrogenase Mo-binding subunit
VTGVGLAAYIEGTGIGPAERAEVVVEPSGDVVVAVGLPSQGQGHETTLAQVCAGTLGVPLDRVRVVAGDTARVPTASGTIASRVAVVAGNAVADAAERVRTLAIELAAEHLEAAPGDLSVTDGYVHVAGSPYRRVALGHLADLAAASGRGGAPTEDQHVEPGLRAWGAFDPPSVTFANGVHAARVAVDTTSGEVRILRYVVVHDCGRVINPVVLDGQIAGGVAQGIGAALLEEVVYDENGQLLSATFGDYLLPLATDIPPIDVRHVETPSERNPLGIKGAGEAGTIPVQAAIAGAVEDALRNPDVVVTTCPLTPARVWDLVHRKPSQGGQRGN